ncbi:hypothetical protein PVAP13_5KG047315, partial [Panicum virgatum]
KGRKTETRTVRTRRFRIRSSPFLLPPFFWSPIPKLTTQTWREDCARSEAVCIIGELSSRGNGGALSFRTPMAFPRAPFSVSRAGPPPSWRCVRGLWRRVTCSLFPTGTVPSRPAAPISGVRSAAWTMAGGPADPARWLQGAHHVRFGSRVVHFAHDERLRPERTVVTSTQNI